MIWQGYKQLQFKMDALCCESISHSQHDFLIKLLILDKHGSVENIPKQDKSYLAQSYHHKPGERIQVCQNG
jgi:hypothetical protein